MKTQLPRLLRIDRSDGSRWEGGLEMATEKVSRCSRKEKRSPAVWGAAQLLLAVVVALQTPAAVGDDVPCPLTITWGTTPALPDPWKFVWSQTADNPERKFQLLYGKEMVVCSYYAQAWLNIPGHHALAIQRPVTEGVSPETYSCPANVLQTKIVGPLPPLWSGVTYSFTLHQKSAMSGKVYCAYKGPATLSAPTSPYAIVRPLKLDYPQLTLDPKPPLKQDFAQTFGVTLASLTTFAPQQTVPCPATVKMMGEIRVNGAGLVRYRLLHNGAPGPTKTLNFSKAGTQHPAFDLIVGQKQPPGPPAGTLAAKPPASPIIQGSARIEILEPLVGKKASNDASYSVTCKTVLTSPGGGIAPPPTPPQGPGG